MHLFRAPLQALLAVLAIDGALATSSWTFSDATVSVQSKGVGVGGGLKEKIIPNKPLAAAVKLGTSDTLKVILTTQDGKTTKRPHQAFLLLRDPVSNLDISYPLSIKESGKAKVDLTTKDLPSAFLRSSSPLSASLVIASFGSASTGYNSEVFQILIQSDSDAPIVTEGKPLRYGKLPEIHHIFRSDPKSPNVLISIIFTGAVLATVPALLGAWIYLNANLSHLPTAFQNAPVAHGLFLSSIAGIEFVFLLYYTTWNLFTVLPVLAVLGVIALISGSRALTEVQERRLAGKR